MSDHSRHHLEAATNMVVGTILGQAIMWGFGLGLSTAVWLNVAFVTQSYIRAYLLRLWFARYWIAVDRRI